MRVFTLVIVAVLALGLSLELGGGKVKEGSYCLEFIQNVESQVKQGMNGRQGYLNLCYDLEEHKDYCRLGKFKSFYRELISGKNTSEVCEREVSADRTCKLAKKARISDKKQETKKAFYKKMDDACKEGSEKDVALCKLVHEDPGYVEDIYEKVEKDKTKENICEDGRGPKRKRFGRICQKIAKKAKVDNIKLNSLKANGAFYNMLNDTCKEGLEKDIAYCKLVREDRDLVLSIHEKMQEYKTEDAACHEMDNNICIAAFNEAKHLYDNGDEEDVIKPTVMRNCKGWSDTPELVQELCMEIVDKHLSDAIPQFQQGNTTDEVCRKALERNEKVASGKGDKYCEEVAGNYKRWTDEEESKAKIHDTIVEQFKLGLLNAVEAGVREGKTLKEICKDY